MSKSNPSESQLSTASPGPFSGLKSLNLQVFVMLAKVSCINVKMTRKRLLPAG